jgi:HK97 family phage major capsid protein
MSVTVMGRDYAGRPELVAAIRALDAKYAGRAMPDSALAKWNALNHAAEGLEMDIRRDRLKELARRVGNTEPGFLVGDARPAASESRSAALETVERFTRSGTLSAAAADRLDAHVRTGDPQGLDARYLAAVGAPAYATAWHKLMKDPTNGHLRLEPAEVEAMRAVSRVEVERAAMEGGTGNLGGFALPVEVDPTVLLSSSGAINPLRDLATVRTISTRTWTGVSSEGVAASYDAELEEVSDDSPTFAQPKIETAMGRAFVQASIELFDDWGSITNEMVRLFADARDTLDSTAFLTGSGTDEPEGVLTALSAAEKVETAGSGAFALADLYSLKQSVPDRWKGATTMVAHSDTFDVCWQFVALADTTEAMAMATREGSLLGRPKAEWNSMATGSVAGRKIMIAGDFSQVVIADRIGSSVELVPHIMGANRLPIGARGLFFRWRSGSTVVVPSALRYLEVKA